MNRLGYSGGGEGLGLVAKGGALLAIAAMAIGGCGKVVEATYSPGDAKTYLEDSGYTGVEHTDTDIILPGIRGCGKDDQLGYDFEATGPTGRQVDVKVCKALWKGATIRQG